MGIKRTQEVQGIVDKVVSENIELIESGNMEEYITEDGYELKFDVGPQGIETFVVPPIIPNNR